MDDKDVGKGFGVAVIIAITFFCAVGIGASWFIEGDPTQCFVVDLTLSLRVCILTLTSQCIDTNAILGNADLSYKFHFYDSAAIPMSLGFSLLINGVFLAGSTNDAKLLALPDIYARKYGPLAEVLASCIMIAVFLALTAGKSWAAAPSSRTCPPFSCCRPLRRAASSWTSTPSPAAG